MKEIMAIVRMKKTGVTKRALVETGVAGFTALKVLGRGKLVEDTAVIEPCKEKLLAMAIDDINEVEEAEQEVTSFLDDSRFFPRRLFTILAHDEDVPRIVEAITKVNITERKVGDGIILVLPVDDAVRVRTGESGDAAIW
ncbi:P-II family nitrogen regulator [Methanosphaerula palustris]|uniref:Nitrogen regulatory protein P-II n=1 Tax=Methanosphaerula palustris (strain ATCC BAA-1556 / DSM 19958 / E1-9c) TaxID=521011 RepID=B8GEW5_METPE|nr:P-II family nitrogen regulator [Methanosphaerula palustris]ACL15932.1 nitrogen regulatory protein P-II [Methanosphaerula palustris E1-9c]